MAFWAQIYAEEKFHALPSDGSDIKRVRPPNDQHRPFVIRISTLSNRVSTARSPFRPQHLDHNL